MISAGLVSIAANATTDKQLLDTTKLNKEVNNAEVVLKKVEKKTKELHKVDQSGAPQGNQYPLPVPQELQNVDGNQFKFQRGPKSGLVQSVPPGAPWPVIRCRWCERKGKGQKVS